MPLGWSINFIPKMQSMANTVDEYISELPDDRREAIEKLRQVVLDNIPDGFVEEMNYGTIGYVVPHSLYPNGYHCDTKLPLPFINIANQKIILQFTIWECMLIRNFFRGLQMNTQNIQNLNSIWVRVVFDSRNQNVSLSNLLKNL